MIGAYTSILISYTVTAVLSVGEAVLFGSVTSIPC
jgi:hypothetical protein